MGRLVTQKKEEASEFLASIMLRACYDMEK
jgi:hypothetical protein